MYHDIFKQMKNRYDYDEFTRLCLSQGKEVSSELAFYQLSGVYHAAELQGVEDPDAWLNILNAAHIADIQAKIAAEFTNHAPALPAQPVQVSQRVDGCGGCGGGRVL